MESLPARRVKIRRRPESQKNYTIQISSPSLWTKLMNNEDRNSWKWKYQNSKRSIKHKLNKKLVRQNAFPRVLSNLLMTTVHWTAPRPLSSSTVETPFSLFFIKNVCHAGDRNTSYLTNTFSLKCWKLRKCHSSKLLISYLNFCDTYSDMIGLRL